MAKNDNVDRESRGFMKKDLHQEKEDRDLKSNENLAAAYNILRDLSNDEFESWLEGGDVSSAEYAEAERKFLSQPISEKIADLKRRAALSNALESKVSGATSASIINRAKSALGAVAASVKWYRDLLFFEPQFAAGGNLAAAALVEADKPREIVLAKEFTEFELSRIPWAGPKLKLSKMVDAEKGAAIYHVFVTSINKHAPQTGALRIVLIAPDGQTAEAKLKSGDRKKMFQGVNLPPDSSELRYTLLIEQP
jgi:hypothetical protein